MQSSPQSVYNFLTSERNSTPITKHSPLSSCHHSHPLIYFVSIEFHTLDISMRMKYSMWPFVTGFFHVAYFQGSPMYQSVFHFFLLLNNTLCRYTIFCLSIHLLMDICFHFLASIDNTAINTCVQVFEWICFSFLWGMYLQVKLLSNGKNV